MGWEVLTLGEISRGKESYNMRRVVQGYFKFGDAGSEKGNAGSKIPMVFTVGFAFMIGLVWCTLLAVGFFALQIPVNKVVNHLEIKSK